MSDVSEKLKKLIAEELGREESEVTPEASFINDLGADSLEMAEMMMKLEEAFGITINEEDSQSLKTVGDVTEYIEKALGLPPSPRKSNPVASDDIRMRSKSSK